MDRIICVGENRFSYNTSRAIQFLENNNLDYEYINLYDIDDSFNIKGLKLLYVENDSFLFYRDFDFLQGKFSSNAGKKYKILRSKNFKFYNNFNNHFWCYNKWGLYQLLLRSSIPTPNTKLFNSNYKLSTVIQEANNIRYPIFIRAADADIQPTQNHSLFALDDIDVSNFYNDCATLLCDDFVLQEYIPHDFVVNCSYIFNNTYFTVKIKDKENIRKFKSVAVLPYKDDRNIYTPIVKNISARLGFNCFHVSFALKNNRPVVLNIRVPGNFIEVDAVYNINSMNIMLENYIYGN